MNYNNLYTNSGKMLSPFCYISAIMNIFISIIIFIFIIYFNLFFRKKYLKTMGKILETKCGDSYFNNNNKTVKKKCDLKIKFIDEKNKEHIVFLKETKEYNNFNQPELNDIRYVNIEYDPQNPKYSAEFYINKFVINIILLIIFVFTFGYAIFVYIFRENPLVCGLAAISLIGRK